MHGKVSIMLGGEQRRLYFNNYSVVELGKIYGIDPIEMGNKMMSELNAGDYMRVFSRIVFCGLVGDFYAKDMDMPYDKATVAGWVAEVDMNEFEPVWKCWEATWAVPQIVPEQKEDKMEADNPKKKAKPTASKIK